MAKKNDTLINAPESPEMDKEVQPMPEVESTEKTPPVKNRKAKSVKKPVLKTWQKKKLEDEKKIAKKPMAYR